MRHQPLSKRIMIFMQGMGLRMNHLYQIPEVKIEAKEIIQSTQMREVTLKAAKRDIDIFLATGMGFLLIGFPGGLLCAFLGLGLSIVGVKEIGNILFLAPYSIWASTVNIYYYWFLTSRSAEKKINKRLKSEGPDAIYVRNFWNTPNDIMTIILFLMGVGCGVLIALIPVQV